MDTANHHESAAQAASSDHISSTRKGFFDFFRLPAELRDRIYDLSVQNIVADDECEDITPMQRNPRNASRLNPSASLVNRQMRSEFLPRYHRARGLVLSSMGDQEHSDRLEAFLSRLASRIPMTRWFTLHYAKNARAYFQHEEFHCRLTLVGGTMYERYLECTKENTIGDPTWTAPVANIARLRVTSGHNQRQPDVEAKVLEVIEAFQREHSGGPIVPDVELLRRNLGVLALSDGKVLDDGSTRYKGVRPRR
ncbi:hypothetical protein CLAFUW4_06773 [Fulvia fulva]|uniref:Uncharacterized protein n=1 Tax=Passalora fulva TaxID=5499 RepID=A0A9Q8PB39_PASFU|nr:uncharacterized protein CLAFUR5_06910 [Fulvia fulva]KAK4621282.1 hypothetical protein CLAFUR4_06781 [Fulvia fulva]KAK4623015.1 hypothetical protein CLAFUR0_06776 [Fulvia fulva]UJO19229.1 hypothetical protein CLAFUR5_06910 [Fulvia fulva]WPV16017.1 hypothetical protein CLAFUW4_06773 [Fulvia fulva]WPV30659.1 hypothetical protein CLAFUW7_06772 [Fulvia fulva]